MRMRDAVVGLTLGTSLALGGTAVTARAAELPQPTGKTGSTPSATAEWHYHSTYYNSPTPCENAGKATGLPYTCVAGLPGAVLPFHLYVWY
ncbi:hypothetical protein AB0469_03140 [Streptomyces sp. NPDC093801]|uniref:hypothetical protein n=1 Tax=Streptomyces sp. NPDC093801 TaxID=3155203 RepID=UPI003450E289